MGRKRDLEKAIRISENLVHGVGIRDTARLTASATDTVLKVLIDVGEGCQRLHDELVRELPALCVQFDELWGFVHSKAQRCWVAAAMEANSRFLISVKVGRRDAEMIDSLVMHTRARTTGRPRLFSDGYAPYQEAIEKYYGADADFGRLIKQTSGRRLVHSLRQPVTGALLDPNLISTSYIERLNGTLRDSVSRLRRKTYGFSKSERHYRAHVNLFAFWYNFVREHPAFGKGTPAIWAGIGIESPWTMKELVERALMTLERKIVPLPVAQELERKGRKISYRLGFKERLVEFITDTESAMNYLHPWISQVRFSENLEVFLTASKGKEPLRWLRFEDPENLCGRFKLFFIHKKDGSVEFSDLIREKRYRRPSRMPSKKTAS